MKLNVLTRQLSISMYLARTSKIIYIHAKRSYRSRSPRISKNVHTVHTILVASDNRSTQIRSLYMASFTFMVLVFRNTIPETPLHVVAWLSNGVGYLNPKARDLLVAVVIAVLLGIIILRLFTFR